MAYLEVKNMYKNFGNTEVLKGISFSIEKGDVLSIIGTSGSGKTTLLRCLNFLETPSAGTVVLDGNTLIDSADKRKMSAQEIRAKRKNFGLVFQSFNLFPQYSVFKNVVLAPLLALSEELKEYKAKLIADNKKAKASGKDNLFQIKKALAEYKEKRTVEIKTEAIVLLKKVDLLEKKDAYPCELSGGQQQRVAIARALALKPRILCFDEPTSALDPLLTGEVLKVIRSLKSEDRTMIIVTHEMGFAKNVSDKVIYMADGVIEEEGDPKEVFENPKSEKLKMFLSNLENKEI